MKVYLFDIDSGLYQGEDFLDPREVNEAEGVTKLAPPGPSCGYVPVYDRALGNWKLVPTVSLGKVRDHHD